MGLIYAERKVIASLGEEISAVREASLAPAR